MAITALEITDAAVTVTLDYTENYTFTHAEVLQEFGSTGNPTNQNKMRNRLRQLSRKFDEDIDVDQIFLDWDGSRLIDISIDPKRAGQ